MIKNILAAIIGVAMMVGVAQANVALEAQACAAPVIEYNIDAPFPIIAMLVSQNCEAELVALVDEVPGLEMPTDNPQEYTEALLNISLGMTGELLRQRGHFYQKKAERCQV